MLCGTSTGDILLFVDNTIKDNLETLLTRVPALVGVLKQFETHGIRYGLYAGAHVAVLTGNRVPTDVDIIVHDEDFGALQKAFPDAQSIKEKDGDFLYLGDNKEIECMANAVIEKAGRVFSFRLTDLAVSKLKTYKVGETGINLVDPADTVLLKSILRRGQEENKFDIEDIKAVLATVPIDRDYLHARAVESGAEVYVEDFFKELGVYPEGR